MGTRSMTVRRDKPIFTIIHRMPGKCNPKVSVEHKMTVVLQYILDKRIKKYEE